MVFGETVTRLFALLVLASAMLPGAEVRAQSPEYSIEAIRYAISPDVPVAELVVNGPKDQKVDIAMVVWLIRGGGRTILFDSGFHRDTFLKDFPMKEYLRPDEAVKTAGVNPEDVTDIVISHAHWDHMGGIDLFPKAQCGSSERSIATIRATPGRKAAAMAGSTPTMCRNS